MITFFSRLWIKDFENINSPVVKSAYAKLCSGIGIVINLVLFLLKFFCGTISGSAAILADGFNNLADAITTVISFLGFVVASIGAGKNHPFGHGRCEWLMSVVSSIAVMSMGVTLAQKSIQAIQSPVMVQFDLLTFFILLCSILAKFYMFFYNRRIGREIGSAAMQATATDSISDMVSTSAILFAFFIQSLTDWKIDGWCGLLVSGFIIFSGFKSLGETVGRLLGQSADRTLYDRIEDLADCYPEISGINDLIIHDYGLGHVVISMHIEGTSEEQRPRLNEIAREISYTIYSEIECSITIQIDILDMTKQTAEMIRQTADNVFQNLNLNANLCNYRAIKAGSHTDIMLTIAFPRRLQKHEKEIRLAMENSFRTLHDKYRVISNFVIAVPPRKINLSKGERNEMQNEERVTMLREAPIPHVLLKMGIPTMIGMLVTGIYNLVDAYFVGGLGTSQMGAVSVIFPLGQAVVGLAVLFGGGAASYLSRLLGANERQKANQVASTALYSSLIVAVITISAIVIFMRPVLYGLGATDTIYPYAREYGMIYVISAIFNIFNVTMNNMASSEGAAKVSMTAMLMGAGLNVILDPIFIYGLDTGIAGAAIATAIAQAITTLMYLFYILKKSSIFSFSPKDFRFESSIYKEIFKVGIPTLAFQLATSIAIGFTNTAAKEYGDAAIAAMGIVSRITSMGIYAVSGFAKGFMPIAGYNYGAKQYDRVQEATKTGLIWTSTFCVLLIIFALIFATPIISLFTANDPQVVEIGTFALRMNIIMFAGMGIEAIYSMLSLALGKAAGGWLLSIGRQGIFFIPFILLLPHFIGLSGVILAQPIADALTLIAMFILAIKINKEIKAKQQIIAG